MSNRQINGAPFRRGVTVVVRMEEAAYTLTNDVDEVHVIVANGIVSMPPSPVIAQRHRVLALAGAVNLNGNGHPIVGGASIVPDDTGIDIEFSADGEWVPFGFQNADAKGNTRVATTANTALVGLLVIDGVALAAGDRVLVKNQAAPVQNGIWLAAVGAWSRAPDMSAGTHAEGAFCFVAEGTVNADTGWVCTTNAPADVVGTDPLAFAQFTTAGLSNAAPVNVSKSAASAGVAVEASRGDHKHDIDTAAPSDVGTANAEGVATSLARSDHVHNLPFTPVQTALAAATGAVSVNGQKITNLGTPTVSTDACTKGYADAIAGGLDPKAEVRAATTANTALAGLLVIDGVVLVANDRVLVKNQAAPIDNGIYLAAAGAWTRSTDMVAGSSAQGNYCFVAEGTTQADTGWVCTTDAPTDIVGTDALAFALFTSFPLATVAPADVTKAAAAIGTSSEAARADHKHDITTAAPSDVGTANAEGTATSLARSDHVHNLPFTPVQTALNAASGSVGFNSQDLTSVNSVAILGGTSSTGGGIRTPYNAAAQIVIGGKKAAGTQNDIISKIGAQLYFGINASGGTAWDYIYLVTNQYMVLYPQIQGQFHSSVGHQACWQDQGFSIGSSNSPTWGSGSRGILSIQNAGTAPTTNPTSSGLLYSEAGAGKWRGSGGTVTTFGPADPHCPKCGSDHCFEAETEDHDEYTFVCYRCLMDHVEEMQNTIRDLVSAVESLVSERGGGGVVPKMPQTSHHTFALRERAQKETFWQ